MTMQLHMNFDEIKRFCQTNPLLTDKKVTLSFDESASELYHALRKQQMLNAINAFRGSGMGGGVDELLLDRQQDKRA